MASLFVLDVPEFSPLIAAARADGRVDVRARGPYAELSSAGALVLARAPTGLGRAVWFGALTGGYDGHVARFDEDELQIVDQEERR